jgi:chemotaxis protein histidine kinase CheA
MNQSDSDISTLADDLRFAADCLQLYEQKQAEALAMAGPLAQSLRRLAEAADAGHMPAPQRASFDPLSLFRRVSRRGLMVMRDVAAPLPRFAAPLDDEDLAIPELPSRMAMRASDENLMWARDEMAAARDAALETAKLMPMDALSLRVQHLAAIAQDEGVRSADLAPLSNVWLGASVLQARLMRETGKRVRIEVIADGIYVERRLIAPLAHCVERLVSLAVMGSLEDTEARIVAGKPLEGAVTLIAACDNDGLSLTIADDGAGAPGPAAMEEIHACAIALGGGVQTLTMPGWGSSVTLAIPAPAVGPWRLHIEPLAAPEAGEFRVLKGAIGAGM